MKSRCRRGNCSGAQRVSLRRSKEQQSVNTRAKPPKSPPPDDGVQADRIAPKYEPLRTIPEARFSSFGLDYIKALTDLLALITETQRAGLVEFIIQEKII